MEAATFRKTADIGLRHARANAPFIKKTIRDIPPARGSCPAALVISAGPSLYSRDPAALIKKHGFAGPIVACDGALGYCLRNGIVPDYVVSVDPHPHRIVRWFGDTKLARRPTDSYFRNQDLDDAIARDERKANDELIALVNRHGPRIKAVLATCASPDINERCREAGIETYWWNPIYDDFDDPDSLTSRLHKINRAPCMVTGGNVGASSWVFALSVLRKKMLGLLGMDFSYRPGTPLRKTQYYEIIKELYPNHPEQAYIHIRNPHLKETWFTDPAYYWYRESFLEMAAQTEPDVETHNCSEGGILFGGRVHFTPFEKFLRRFRKGAAAPARRARG